MKCMKKKIKEQELTLPDIKTRYRATGMTQCDTGTGTGTGKGNWSNRIESR